MSSRKPKAPPPPPPDPDPSPTPVEAMTAAKDRVKTQAKRKGRPSNILAGRMMQRALNFGKSRVGE